MVPRATYGVPSNSVAKGRTRLTSIRIAGIVFEQTFSTCMILQTNRSENVGTFKSGESRLFLHGQGEVAETVVCVTISEDLRRRNGDFN